MWKFWFFHAFLHICISLNQNVYEPATSIRPSICLSFHFFVCLSPRPFHTTFERHLDEWYPMTLGPWRFSFIRNIPFLPGYKNHCFYRSGSWVGSPPSSISDSITDIGHRKLSFTNFLQKKKCFIVMFFTFAYGQIKEALRTQHGLSVRLSVCSISSIIALICTKFREMDL